MNQFETSATANFVAPVYCKQLVDLGLSPRVLYYWKVFGDHAELITHSFDLDKYYIDGMRAQDFVTPPDLILPAYSIKDVEKLLPKDYLMMFTAACEYIVAPGNIYEVEGCTADRMPDAFAMMLIQYIKKRALDLNKINLIISGEKTF